MKDLFFLNLHSPHDCPTKRTHGFGVFRFLSIVGASVFLVAASSTVHAQFTTAADNAGNYGGTWSSTSPAGSFGFGNWTFTANGGSGGSAGRFLGNPGSGGISGMNSTSFGLFANPNVSDNESKARRSFSGGSLAVGDTFAFQMGMNWDAGTSSGFKGVDLRSASGNVILNFNMGNSSTITWGPNGGTLFSAYGTQAMNFSITYLGSNQVRVVVTPRTGSTVFDQTITLASEIAGFEFYMGRMTDSNANRQLYFNDFSITTSGNYDYGGTVTQPRALTGEGALSVSANTTLQLTANGNTFTGGTTVASGSTLSVGGGGGTGDLSGNVDNSGTVAFNRTGALTYAGQISGSGGLSKSGTGTVTLTGASSYSGATTVAGGALRVGNSSALGSSSGVTVNTGASLQLSNSVNMASGLALTISSDGGGAGALRNISGNNTWQGNITLGSGDVRVNNDSGNLTLSGGIDFANGTFYVGGVGTSTVLSGAFSNAGKTTGNGALWLDATGVVRLDGANQTALTGNINLRRGTILIGANGALGTGAIRAGDSSAVTIASVGTTARSLGNSVTMSTNTTITFGNNENTGDLAFAGGLDFGATASANRFINVTNAATRVSFGGAVVGAGKNLVKVGAGTMSLGGNNTYTGLTAIDTGTVEITGGTQATSGIDIGTLTTEFTAQAAKLRVAGADGFTLDRNITVRTGGDRTLEFGQASGVNTASGDVTLSKNLAVSVASETAAGVLSGTLSGAGAVVMSGDGRLTLSGANSFGGGVNFGSGFLRLNSATAAGTGIITQTSESSTLEINTSGTIANDMSVYNVAFLQGATLSGNITVNNATFDVAESEASTISGVVSGEAGVNKTGLGQLTLTGNNTYTGATTVGAGILELASTSGAAAGATASVSVAEGATLLLSQSNQVNSSATVTLSGGTITRASGVSEVFGNLNLTQASLLDFGTGDTGTLSFGTYTPSSLLTVNNFGLGNVLTFGSDLTGSIGGALFSFDNAFTSSWDSGTSTFTITAIPEPSTYAAAAGLIALMLWPARRRLLKDAKSILGLRATGRDRIQSYRNA